MQGRRLLFDGEVPVSTNDDASAIERFAPPSERSRQPSTLPLQPGEFIAPSAPAPPQPNVAGTTSDSNHLAPQSWEDYQTISGDERERRATELRGRESQARQWHRYQERVKHYQIAKLVVALVVGGYVLFYVLAMIAWSRRDAVDMSFGSVMWVATMFGAGILYVAWHVLRAFHPGVFIPPTLPDETPRHGGLEEPKKPGWDRRR